MHYPPVYEFCRLLLRLSLDTFFTPFQSHCQGLFTGRQKIIPGCDSIACPREIYLSHQKFPPGWILQVFADTGFFPYVGASFPEEFSLPRGIINLKRIDFLFF
jgi:hypothetical protein